jgi:tRNA A-37 threonylcarbamoyl transferase component Bud32
LELPPELANHPRYRILRELGRGGMGVVYQARQIVMNRPVVIKVINKALLDHPGSLERFRREVQAAARLAHPNIVTAYDAEQAGELHMLVMEFVPGQSLAEVLQKKGPLAVLHACVYARQAALGLQHAHEQGMVHRDIKPHNLMLTPKGQVKILDFGLAKIISENRVQPSLTALSSYMGTPDYSAPEQATDARKADIRADIYSLGCTLYCLLAGRPPFHEATAVQTILAHLEKEPTPLPRLRPDVPESLWHVVATTLAKDPARRYQKPAEVAQALAPFCKGGTRAAAAPRGMPPRVATATAVTVPPHAGPPPAGRGAPFPELTAEPEGNDKAPSRVARTRNGWLLGGAVAVALLAVAAGMGLLAQLVFKVRTPDGTVVLELDPADAEVTVDGRQIKVNLAGDQEPIQIELPQGKHELKVTKGGFQVFSRELTLQAGKNERIKVSLVSESRDAIDRGVAYLKSLQKADGTWPFTEVGATALAGLTLLECGVPPDDPAVQKAAAAIRRAGVALTHTYSLALSILFFDRLGEPEDVPLIESMAVRLLAGQSTLGGWNYTCPSLSDAEMRRLNNLPRLPRKPGAARSRPRAGRGKRTVNDLPPEIRDQLKLLDNPTPAALKAREHADDNSNTQYAALALWVARRYGLPTEAALGLVDARFRTSPNADGGWGYKYVPGATGGTTAATMTCAGLFGLALGHGAADADREHPDPIKDPVIRAALVAAGKMLGMAASIGKDPLPGSEGNLYYYLWALERVGIAYGLKTIGGKDWYGWGKDYLMANQQKDGSWRGAYAAYGADTCFALLFLRRANLAPGLTATLQGKVSDPGAGGAGGDH